MNLELFPATSDALPERQVLGQGAVLLRRFAAGQDAALTAAIDSVTQLAPFRHMLTPGGFRMSVAMSNCGLAGWVTDRKGYRYASHDPLTGLRWPAMPETLRTLAVAAADAAGYPCFVPDACLINRYVPGARMTLHQDRDERDMTAPIVSISLGLPARFLFGGPSRGSPVLRIALSHGDAVVWGGESRLHFHGVSALQAGTHPFAAETRLNLTFRRGL